MERKDYIKLLLIMIAIVVLSTTSAGAANKTVTMQVGETMTLRLPSSITSLAMRGAQWTSTCPNEVQIVSQTTYSATIKVLKAVPSTTTCLIHCQYYYLVNNAGFTYQLSGIYDFKVETESNEPTSVSLPSSVTLNVGESRYLTASLTPNDAQTEMTWSSSNYATINVFQNGRILAQKEGTSIITVKTSNGKTATCTVNAIRPTVDITSVAITPVSYTIKVGEEYKLNAVISPSNATDKEVIWSSSQSSIVSVDKTGNIAGLKAGTATISATASNGISATCTVICQPVIPDIEISDKDGLAEIPAIANIRYDRTMYAGWNSVCVPFALNQTMLDDFSEGCKIALVETFEVVGDKRHITIKEVTSVGAGIPCLIYAPSDVLCKFKLDNAELNVSPDNSSIMKAAFQKTCIGAGVYKLTEDGTAFGLTKTDEATVAPFRCYIQIQPQKPTK